MESLDSNKRKKSHPLVNAGVNGKVDYRFVQLVHLLEEMNASFVSVGEGSDPNAELIRFEGNFDFIFPAEDIQKIQPGKEGENPVQVKLNFLTLGGVFGPLPVPYSQLVLERYNQKDRGAAKFLNNFVHRLASLVYRVKRHHRPGFNGDSIENEKFAQHAFSLLGLGNSQVKNRLALSDRGQLGYSSLFLSGSRSKEGLSRFLSHYFGIRIEIQPYAGKWESIPNRHQSTISKKSINNVLGKTLVLGQKAWLDQSHFIIRIPSINLSEYLDFLPEGSAFKSIRDLVRIYCGDEFDNTLELYLRTEHIPGTCLGKPAEKKNVEVIETPRLGWDFFLRTSHSQPIETQPKRLDLNQNI